jgi:hypothetical protein
MSAKLEHLRLVHLPLQSLAASPLPTLSKGGARRVEECVTADYVLA